MHKTKISFFLGLGPFSFEKGVIKVRSGGVGEDSYLRESTVALRAKAAQELKPALPRGAEPEQHEVDD